MVLVGQNGQLVADQSAAQRAAAIDQQHFAVATPGEQFAHQRVVFEQLQCDDLSAEFGSPAVALEHGRDDAQAAIANLVFVVVEEVGSLETHGACLVYSTAWGKGNAPEFLRRAADSRAASGDDFGFFLEDQPDCLVVVEVDGDVATVGQPTKQQFVGQ